MQLPNIIELDLTVNVRDKESKPLILENCPYLKKFYFHQISIGLDLTVKTCDSLESLKIVTSQPRNIIIED